MATVERDIRVLTRDGVELSTDVYHPDGTGPFPTLLQRTCYGKEVLADWTGVKRYVDAGYRVVFQDTRGTGRSTGEAVFQCEAPDGRDSADWITEQGWFDGRLGTFGASYMGFTQWALASTKPPYLKTMAISTMGAQRGAAWFPGGSFALDIALPWTVTRVKGFDVGTSEQDAALAAAFMHLPLEEADLVAVGEHVPWYQEWLQHPDADDPFWSDLDLTSALDIDIPVLMIDGWHDYAVPLMLRDRDIRDAKGLPTRLIVGPWTHFGASEDLFDETLRWFDRHLRGDTTVPAAGPARVYVMPDAGWRELAAWPPPTEPESWWLQPDGGLGRTLPSSSDPTPYTYDPADPTPAYGGAGLRMDCCGPVDNRELEARPDVLTFSSAVLPEELEVIGPVRVELFLRSDVDNFDVYLRLCDVWPDGRSINICDGIRRLKPADIVRHRDGSFPVAVEMWPTAQRFAAGHQVRLQVSGGAHPLFARNTCSGEPLGSARTIVVAHNAVHHDPDHPSQLVLARSRIS